VAAGFGMAHRIASGGQAAARTKARRGRLQRSIGSRGPALIIERTLFETGLRKSEGALVVSDEAGPSDPAGVGAGDTPDDPAVGRDWHPKKESRPRRGHA
jgi:hypothetical protein